MQYQRLPTRTLMRQPTEQQEMSLSQAMTLDRQTSLAIATGAASEVWFFGGKVTHVSYRH